MASKRKINAALKTLTLAYISNLVSTFHSLTISETYFALKELNEARLKAGLKPAKIDLKALKAQHEKAVADYKKLLETKKGTYVVIHDEVNKTEKLEFKPWLKDLSDNTKTLLVDIFDNSTKEGWDSERLKSELDKVETYDKNVRAKTAAFVETRTQQNKIRMATWKAGGVTYVQRHISEVGTVCPICLDLDGEVYPIGEESPLSHEGCQCWYSIYSFNNSDEDITDQLNEGD